MLRAFRLKNDRFQIRFNQKYPLTVRLAAPFAS